MRCECGAQLQEGSRFCTQCGREQVRDTGLDVISCPECGEQNSIDSCFCTNCGSSFAQSQGFAQQPTQAVPQVQHPAQVYYGNPAPQQPAPQYQGNGNKLTIIIIAAIAVVAVIIVLLLLFNPFKSADAPANQTLNVGNTPAASGNVNANASNANANANSASVSNTTTVKPSTDVAGSNAAQLSVQTVGGKTLSGTVRRDANGYVIADSSTREYTLSELSALNLSPAEMCIAWNEPFAREGYSFSNPGLQAYFKSTSWYHDSGRKFNLSGVAATNSQRLQQLAQGTEADQWKNLATS